MDNAASEIDVIIVDGDSRLGITRGRGLVVFEAEGLVVDAGGLVIDSGCWDWSWG